MVENVLRHDQILKSISEEKVYGKGKTKSSLLQNHWKGNGLPVRVVVQTRTERERWLFRQRIAFSL